MAGVTTQPAQKSALKVGRTATGFVVRVEGRGTMQESSAALQFARRAAADRNEPAAGSNAAGDRTTFALDLSACDYLDSTFLGCVLGMQKEYAGHRAAFSVIMPRERAGKLFGPTRLDQLLPITPQPQEVVCEWEDLSPAGLEPGAQSEHVMECHRRLAEVDCPQRETFRRIADCMAKELEKGQRMGNG